LKHSDVLNSWKEIAEYLGRGLRTAQRWERDLGLPVRRPRGRMRTAVIALRWEIDAWINDCPQSRRVEDTPSPERPDRDLDALGDNTR
jgi:hypothetical protein